MKDTRIEQPTIRPGMRREQAARARVQVRLVAQPNGVLVVKVAKGAHDEGSQTNSPDGSQIKGRSRDWLRLTRRSPMPR